MKSRNKGMVAIVMIISIALLIVSGNYIFKNMSMQIYEESARHLLELANQITINIKNEIESKSNIALFAAEELNGTSHDGNDEFFEKVVSLENRGLGMSALVVTDEGTIYNTKRQRVQLEKQRDLSAMPESHAVIIDSFYGNQDETYLMYVNKLEQPARVDNKNFTAIVLVQPFGYIADMLEVESFDEEGRFHIVQKDGTCLYCANESADQIKNILSYLGEGYSLTRGDDFQVIGDKIATGESGCSEGIEKRSKQGSYLAFTPIGVNDWQLFMAFSVDLVNGSMRKFSKDILAGIVMLCILAFGILLASVLIYARKKIRDKDGDIYFREELFSMFALQVDVIYILLDRKSWSIQYITPNIQRILGIAAEDIHITSDGLTHEKCDISRLEREKAMKEWDKKTPFIYECEFVNAVTEEYKWMQIEIQLDQSKDMQKYLIVLSDRTKERKVKQGLSDALLAAQIASNSKTKFLSNMSHDIRTPMNGIIGMTDIAYRNLDNPEHVKSCLDKIRYSSKHLLGLINDVLDMSKIESGKMLLNYEHCNMSELFDSIVAIIHPQAKAAGCDFGITLKNVKHENIITDITRLNQVFINILSNAVKFTPAGGRIWVIIEERERADNRIGYHFEFSDTGCGMSEEFQDVIFEIFTQENGENQSKNRGTGLGMAITRNIIDLMNGSITIKSAPDKGTTFYIDLIFDGPVEEEEVGDEFKDIRVLVVDDDLEICTQVSKTLTDLGAIADYALAGEQAIHMVDRASKQNQDYSVALVDWKMPKMDGVQTARQIQHLTKNGLPIIVISAYDFTEVEEEAREAGVLGYISKPLFKSNLITALRHYTGDNDKANKNQVGYFTKKLLGMHILVAEDNELNMEIIVTQLKDFGADVEQAFNGKEAVEMVQNSREYYYDCILMDMQMPVMDGCEATIEIRKMDREDSKVLPIIAVTANAFEDDVRAVHEAGMNAHIAKPINAGSLVDTISEYRKI